MSKADDAPIMPMLSAADLDTTTNHEPRIRDLRLAEALGFERPTNIRRLIERHRAALERFGEVCSTVEQTPRQRGRPGLTLRLTKRQALYLCTKSETERATEITILVVEVFDAYTSDRTALPPPEKQTEEAAPELEAPQPRTRFWDLVTAASATFTLWNNEGIVADTDRAMWIAMQAVCDVAGVDARMEAAAGLKRRGQTRPR